mmetsp:Transcript_35856/g.54993  ORF Transcript_35856/g.54993 Transcript_35856/m.54993 type:complete len:136 (+) Transcript_35856:2796-3203(+)
MDAQDQDKKDMKNGSSLEFKQVAAEFKDEVQISSPRLQGNNDDMNFDATQMETMYSERMNLPDIPTFGDRSHGTSAVVRAKANVSPFLENLSAALPKRRFKTKLGHYPERHSNNGSGLSNIVEMTRNYRRRTSEL